MNRTHKAVVYLVRSRELLVFTQPATPEAGVQVPAGTIRDGEEPSAAAVRELEQETGIVDVDEISLLGTAEYDMASYGREEVQERHFAALRCLHALPERWTCFERHDGRGKPDQLDLFWISVAGAADRLEAGHGLVWTGLSAPLLVHHKRNSPHKARRTTIYSAIPTSAAGRPNSRSLWNGRRRRGPSRRPLASR